MNPLLLASIISTAVGTLGQLREQERLRDQQRERLEWRRKRTQLESQRQEEERRRAAQAVSQATEQLAPASQQKQVQDRAQQLSRGFEQAAGAPDPNNTAAAAASVALPGSQYGGEVVQTDLARRLTETARDTQGRLGALARMTAFGEQGANNAITLGRSAEGINLANNARSGSLRTLGGELNAMDNAPYSPPNPIWGGLQAAGQMGMYAAGRGSTLADLFGGGQSPPSGGGMGLGAPRVNPKSGLTPWAT